MPVLPPTPRNAPRRVPPGKRAGESQAPRSPSAPWPRFSSCKTIPGTAARRFLPFPLKALASWLSHVSPAWGSGFLRAPPHPGPRPPGTPQQRRKTAVLMCLLIPIACAVVRAGEVPPRGRRQGHPKSSAGDTAARSPSPSIHRTPAQTKEPSVRDTRALCFSFHGTYIYPLTSEIFLTQLYAAKIIIF